MDLHGLNRPYPKGAMGAANELNDIFEDVNHPYHAPDGHPLKARAKKRVSKLFAIKAKGYVKPKVKAGTILGGPHGSL